MPSHAYIVIWRVLRAVDINAEALSMWQTVYILAEIDKTQAQYYWNWVGHCIKLDIGLEIELDIELVIIIISIDLFHTERLTHLAINLCLNN